MSIWSESDTGPPMQKIFTSRTHAATTDPDLVVTGAGRYLLAVNQKRPPALGSVMGAAWLWRLARRNQACSPDLLTLAGPALTAQWPKSAAP